MCLCTGQTPLCLRSTKEEQRTIMIWTAFEPADSTLPADTALMKSTSQHIAFLHCVDKRCNGVSFLLVVGIFSIRSASGVPVNRIVVLLRKERE